jgi:hypothetical protein
MGDRFTSEQKMDAKKEKHGDVHPLVREFSLSTLSRISRSGKQRSYAQGIVVLVQKRLKTALTVFRSLCLKEVEKRGVSISLHKPSSTTPFLLILPRLSSSSFHFPPFPAST